LRKKTGGFMAKLPAERGVGLIEWILIAVLILMVLVTVFLLLEPALVNLWQGMLQSIQE
jgi:Flp pilus assembly pilin Flp